MKFRIRLLAALLLLTLACSMTGCSLLTKAVNAGKNTKSLVEAELNAFAAGDEAAAYAGLYPGQVSEEEFSELFERMKEYCPIPAEYSLTLVNVNTSTNYTVGGKKDIVQGDYLLSFDGQSFHVLVSYVTDQNGSGFQGWRVLNEEDYKIYQGVG